MTIRKCKYTGRYVVSQTVFGKTFVRVSLSLHLAIMRLYSSCWNFHKNCLESKQTFLNYRG